MINQKLLEARERKYLTQEQLAQMVGVEPFTISRWERGIQKPRFYMINRLVKALSTSPEELGYSPSGQIVSSEKNDFMPFERDWAAWFGLKQAQITAMIIQWHGKAPSCDQVQLIIDQEIKTMDNELEQYQGNEQENISRRQALIAIAALPTLLTAWGNITQEGTEDFITQCAASITSCWHLMKGKGSNAVGEIIPQFMPHLSSIALHTGSKQQEAAKIATQASIIQAILSMHQLNFKAREVHCNNAIRYARASNDIHLQAAAHMYLGYTLSFCYQPRQAQRAIPIFLKGLEILGEDNSIIKSDILMGIAEAHAQCKDEQNALKYIELAQNHFPMYPEDDPSYIYAECGLTTLYQWEGKMYLELTDYYTNKGYQQKASNALMKSIGVSSLNERCTTETVIYQADAARVLGELEIYTDSLTHAAQMAIELRSRKRYDEALQVYHRTPETWIREPRIQTLARDTFRQLPARKANS